jgi:hypothetical protein
MAQLFLGNRLISVLSTNGGIANLGTIECSMSTFNNMYELLTEGNYNLVFFDTEGFLDQESGVGEGGYYQAYLSGDGELYIEDAEHLYKYVELSTTSFKIEEIKKREEYFNIALNDAQNSTITADTPTLELTASQASGVILNHDKNIAIYGLTNWEGYENPAIYLKKTFSANNSSGEVAFVSFEGNFVHIINKKVYIVYLLIDVKNNQVYVRLEENANFNE